MGCEYTIVARAIDKGAAPPLPDMPLAEQGSRRTDTYRKHARPCGKDALYYEIAGLVSLTTMYLCEEHRHEIASLGKYQLVLTMPPASPPTEEPVGLPPAYKVPKERGGI
jgi:hypothetical protein